MPRPSLCRTLGRADLTALSPTDAVLLNNIVQNFGMLDLVKKVLASHKCQMDRSREQYARDLAGAWGAHIPGAGPKPTQDRRALALSGAVRRRLPSWRGRLLP